MTTQPECMAIPFGGGRGVQGGVAARRSAAEPDELRIPLGRRTLRKEWTTTGN